MTLVPKARCKAQKAHMRTVLSIRLYACHSQSTSIGLENHPSGCSTRRAMVQVKDPTCLPERLEKRFEFRILDCNKSNSHPTRRWL